MKSLKYIIAGLVVCGGFTACSLDEDPLYSQNSKVVFSSSENAEMGLKGCYAYMTSSSAFGQWWQEGPIRHSGISWGQRSGGDNDMNLLDMNAANSWVTIMWKGMYKAISETNAFLSSMNEASFDEASKNQLVGEAHVLRGIQYYYMATHFGSVPLKVIASSSDGVACTRDSREAIFAQVVSDLEAGMDIATSADPGRVTSYTAKAMLAKTYMRMAQLSQLKDDALDLAAMGLTRQACLEKAQALFKEVYDAKVYSLEPNYADIWGEYYNGKECVFMLATSIDGTSDTFNRGTNRFAPTSSTGGIAWGTTRVQKFAYDYMWSLYPNDPRLDVTFLTKWRKRNGNNQPNPSPAVLSESELIANDSIYTYPYWAYTDTLDYLGNDVVTENGTATAAYRMHAVRLPYEVFENPANPDTAEIGNWMRLDENKQYIQNWTVTREEKRGKFTYTETKGVTNPSTRFLAVGDNNKWPYYGKLFCVHATGQRAAMNIVIYRYAELLLNYADVENELGNGAKAVALVKEMLSRSNSVPAKEDYWSESQTQEQLRKKIFIERVLETIGELNNWDCMRMMGTEGLKHFCQLNNEHNITGICDDLYLNGNVNNFLDYRYNHGVLDGDNGYNWLRKNLLFPIPTSEIDANPGLTNADNNFGY